MKSEAERKSDQESKAKVRQDRSPKIMLSDMSKSSASRVGIQKGDVFAVIEF